MRLLNLKLLGWLLLFCLSFSAAAQDKRKLERKRADLNKKIEQTNELIQRTKAEQANRQTHLSAITGQIKLREELIGTISTEIGSLDHSIVQRNKRIEQKRSELEQLKNEYRQLIRYAQKNQSSYNRLMFIFASGDFHQAFKRVKYLQQHTLSRRQQAERIEHVKQVLGTEIRNLSDQKLEKTVLLGSKEHEKQALAHDKVEEQKTLASLQQEESKLRAQLAKQQSERKRIDAEIERLIASEIKKSKATNKGTFKLAPEAKDLSDNFAANKGRLSWPVDRGFISGRFGKQAHPVLRNIIIDNNGIDITTDKEAPVKAIFKGTVSSILVIPGAGKVVVLDHGAYRSIYTQLKEVYVSKGQKVEIKTKLGICLPGESDSRSEAHLEIWKIGQDGTQKMNPALWIHQ